jgi:transposase
MKYMTTKAREAVAQIIEDAIAGKHTNKFAALKLGVTERHVRRIKSAYKSKGASALIHGNSGRHPANYTAEELRKRIIALKKTDDYRDMNYKHFKECLESERHIRISYSALSSTLKEASPPSKKSRRTGKQRFGSRQRRAMFGELLQGDGSSFQWFGTREYVNLHGFIDDASGKITGLYFCKNECLTGYLEVLRQTLLDYGVPAEMHLDKAGIFFVNTKKEANWTIDEQLAGHALNKTQFGAILEDRLGCHLIPANTPQAKGRIERLWQTLQDRLVIWLSRRGIKNMEQANPALPDFIREYNAQFAANPSSDEIAFVPLRQEDDLDRLLTARYERVTDNRGCFSFQNYKFQIESKKPMAKKKIVFLFSERIGFHACAVGECFLVTLIGLPKTGNADHIPDVTKQLMYRQFYADGKMNPLPDAT